MNMTILEKSRRIFIKFSKIPNSNVMLECFISTKFFYSRAFNHRLCIRSLLLIFKRCMTFRPTGFQLKLVQIEYYKDGIKVRKHHYFDEEKDHEATLLPSTEATKPLTKTTIFETSTIHS